MSRYRNPIFNSFFFISLSDTFIIYMYTLFYINLLYLAVDWGLFILENI